MSKKTNPRLSREKDVLDVVRFTCVALQMPLCANLTEASERIKTLKKLLRARIGELTRLEKMVDDVRIDPKLVPADIPLKMWTDDFLREQMFGLLSDAPWSKRDVIRFFTDGTIAWLLKGDVERVFDVMEQRGELVYTSAGWCAHNKNWPMKWPAEPPKGVIH